jgi:hypothetical protein
MGGFIRILLPHACVGYIGQLCLLHNEYKSVSPNDSYCLNVNVLPLVLYVRMFTFSLRNHLATIPFPAVNFISEIARVF